MFVDQDYWWPAENKRTISTLVKDRTYWTSRLRHRNQPKSMWSAFIKCNYIVEHGSCARAECGTAVSAPKCWPLAENNINININAFRLHIPGTYSQVEISINNHTYVNLNCIYNQTCNLFVPPLPLASTERLRLFLPHVGGSSKYLSIEGLRKLACWNMLFPPSGEGLVEVVGLVGLECTSDSIVIAVLVGVEIFGFLYYRGSRKR